MVKKPDGSNRLCIDYRTLNQAIEPQRWPMKRVDEIIRGLSGLKYCSPLDLLKGYYQIQIHPDSTKYTAFTTPQGHYEFLRMPFGIRTAPSQFSKIMHSIFGDLEFIHIYLDDLTVHSKSFEDHIEHLRITFDRLRAANLKLNPSKFKFFATEAKVLGFIVSGETVKMDPEKIKAIIERLPLRNIKDVQIFNGGVGYNRNFIKNLAEISHPIYKLLSHDKKFEWTNECQLAFDNLKQILVSYPILRQPNFDLEFFIFTDGSKYVIGWTLAQKPSPKEEYTIEYGYKLLKKIRNKLDNLRD